MMSGRTVKIHFFGSSEIKETSEEEAKKILSETYSSACGGLVIDVMTNKVIYRIDPDVEEITVLEAFLGGG
jgi:hypothetical protein